MVTCQDMGTDVRTRARTYLLIRCTQIQAYIYQHTHTRTLPSSCFPSLFLIQLTACICGSIHSGHLLARIVRIPFCMLSSSEGSPSLAHWVVSTSLVNRSSSLHTHTHTRTHTHTHTHTHTRTHTHTHTHTHTTSKFCGPLGTCAPARQHGGWLGTHTLTFHMCVCVCVSGFYL